MKRPFSEEEDLLIREMTEQGHISKVIAKKLERDKKEVRARIQELGLEPINPLLNKLRPNK